jgi:ribosomal protein S18 acetylase RimI-like enzyme
VEPVVRIAAATPADAVELAAVAARTFPLACPPSVALPDMAAFIDANLSDARFAEYLADPQRRIFTAAVEGRIIGYAMLISGVGDDPEVQRAVDIRPAAEISKMYVVAAHHGSGAATALMDAALAASAEWEAGCVWLGVNQKNERAQRFYQRCGFTVNGTRSFRLGDHTESDYVMVRPLHAA